MHVMLTALAPLVRLAQVIVPNHPALVESRISTLDAGARDHTPRTLACAQRELLRLAEPVEAMIVLGMHLFRDWDPDRARMIEVRKNDVDRMPFEIKIYLSPAGHRHDSGRREEDVGPGDEGEWSCGGRGSGQCPPRRFGPQDAE